METCFKCHKSVAGDLKNTLFFKAGRHFHIARNVNDPTTPFSSPHIKISNVVKKTLDKRVDI